MKRILLIAVLGPFSASTVDAGNLKDSVRKEGKQFDDALRKRDKSQDSAEAARKNLVDLEAAKQAGETLGKTGGKSCEIDSCIARQEKRVSERDGKLTASSEKARKEARQYIDKEKAFFDKTGHFLNPDRFEAANRLLNGPAPASSAAADAGGSPAQATPASAGACVDSFGIPCIPDGRAVHGGGQEPPNLRPTATDSPYAGLAGRGGGPQGIVTPSGTADSPGGPAGSPFFRSVGGLEASVADGALVGEPPSSARHASQRPGGDFRDALGSIRRRGGIRPPPGTSATVLRSAQAAGERGDWEAAERSAREAITAAPKDSGGGKALALALANLSRFDEALAAADMAVRLDPTDPVAHMLRGFVLGKMDRHDEASTELALAARLDPEGFIDLSRFGRMAAPLLADRLGRMIWRSPSVPSAVPNAAPLRIGTGRSFGHPLLWGTGIFALVMIALDRWAAWRLKRRGGVWRFSAEG